MSIALWTAILGLLGTGLTFFVKWYWDKKRAKEAEEAALKKAEADAEQAAQDQKKNQEAVNDSIRKQVDAADSWQGKP